MGAAAPQDDASEFSPIENDPPLRGWRGTGIVPRDGLGVVRRAVLLALFTWLPIAVWAAATGQLSGGGHETILQHYGVHVRCLIVTPCLVLGEQSLHRVGRYIAWQFDTSGLVTPAVRPDYDRILGALIRLRDASIPWVFAVGGAIALSIADSPRAGSDRVAWAYGPDGRIGFGGLWFAYVARPILVALVLGWFWRVVLVTVWMWRVSRLPLAFVASHPDRTAGIGFVEVLPGAFAPVTFATAALLVGRWAHEVVHHGAQLTAFQAPAIAYVLLWSGALLAPLLALGPVLFSTRRTALPMHAALVGDQGRALYRRWIEREPVDDALLEHPGIGVMVDAASYYEAVKSMRVVPIGKSTLVAIVAPMAIPFVVLGSLQFPIGTILLALLKALA